ncbi:MAG: hypothetical protein D6766_06220 [Verrucomicrobia bacterium]|nr:MAG: hypothetical protein D6766_06220 [Verrucomicrobiota bacterium]
MLEGRAHRALLAAELAELSRPGLWVGELRRHARLWKRALAVAAPVAGWLAARVGRRRREGLRQERIHPARVLRWLEWAGPLALWWLKERRRSGGGMGRPPAPGR